MPSTTSTSSSTDLTSIKNNEVIVDANKSIVTHPTEEVTNKQAMQIINDTSTSTSEVINHYISQTTSIPQSASINYIGDVNIEAYVRRQKIDFVTYNMRPSRRVYSFFDDKNVTDLIQKPNIIELDNNASYIGIQPFALKNLNVINTNDPVINKQIDASREVVFFGNNSSVYAYVYFTERTSTGNTRLYVSEIIADNTIPSITTGTKVRALSSKSGVIGVIAFPSVRSNVVSYQHNSGILRYNTEVPSFTSSSNVWYTTSANTYGTSNTFFNKKVVTLALDASSVNNYYVGNTITIVNSLVPGETANIISYNGSTKTAVVEPAFKGLYGGDETFIYTIGDPREGTSSNNSLYTTTKGFIGGSLYIPPPWKSGKYFWKIGEKLLKISDSINNRSKDATTIAEYVYNTFGLNIGKGQLTIDYFTNAVTGQGTDSINSLQPAVIPITPPTNVGDPIILPEVDTGTNDVTKSIRTSFLAQSFLISESEYPKGFFIPYIDLFFANKGTLGIELQIRPIVNGYPDSKNILPNAVAFHEAEDVNVSDSPSTSDSNTFTRFAFKSPVYVLPGQEYAMCISTNDYDYDIYIAELGENTIGSNRKVSQQPYSGSVFRSQNSSTYEPIQSEDLMFVIHKCQFVSDGYIEFNEEKRLDRQNGLFNYYYDGNTAFDAFQIHTNVIKLPATDVIYNYKATTLATNTMDAEYDVFKPETKIILGNRKTVYAPVIGNKSFMMRVDLATSNRDVSPILYKEQQQLYTMATLINNMGVRPSLISVANTGTGYTYTNTSVAFSGTTGSGANGTIAVQFEDYTSGKVAGIYMDEQGSGYYGDIDVSLTSSDGSNAVLTVSSETDSSGGPSIARYISKTITLAPQFDAGDLRVYLTAIRPQEANIEVYYKVKNPYDEDEISNKNWVRMERVTGTTEYSPDLGTPIEYEYRPSLSANAIVYSTSTATFTSFNQFKIKIVLASSGTSFTQIPYVYDMRAVALPADTF
jgi:hypothetical protein